MGKIFLGNTNVRKLLLYAGHLNEFIGSSTEI